MKTCKNCGAAIEEKNRFCSHCGTRCEDGVDTSSDTAPPAVLQENQHEETSTANINEYPMKWHNFQMVIMILGGILTIANGLSQLMGAGYMREGITAAQIYGRFPGLKSCDVFYGIVLIALGVYEFVVRNRLNKFQVNGPGSLKTLYFLSIAGSLIYLLWASSTTGVNLLTSDNLGSLISSVAFLCINSIYYSKRSSLFIN